MATGDDVSRFQADELVYATSFLNPTGGFYAEYAVVDAELVSHLPGGLTLQTAGVGPGAAMTGLRGLEDTLQVQSGESLMVFGAGGGIGHTAIQLAKKLGARVLAVASGADGVQLAERLGADAAVDGRQDDLEGATAEFAPDGLDALLLTAGGDNAEAALGVVRKGGRAAYPTGVTTSEPMVCVIVWGEDDSFGRFNNSLSMDGTGIEQHDVVLPDVQPGVEYRFVVQGSTADGTLYRSEVGSFRIERSTTPAATVDRGKNLAQGATVVEVSSEFAADFVGALAVDGDTSTEWATRGDGDAGFITVDLGSSDELGGVEFVTRSMADGSARTETFTVTVDGGAPLGPFPAATVADPGFAEIDLTGRLVRFAVHTSTGGNVGDVEIGIFGPAP